jgi:predicted ATPase
MTIDGPDGQTRLTRREADLVAYLYRHRERIVPRDELLSEVSGYRPGLPTRAIDNTVARLRRKVEPDPQHPQFVVSVFGEGYALRDVREVERAPAPDTPPRWGNPLPRERDAFVGRTRELERLERLLDGGAALVTLHGPGGAGKTRLVVRYAHAHLDRWPGGAWFCDLSEARDLDGIVAAVGHALRVTVSSEPVRQLGWAMASRGRCLVILDNFEQVAAHAPTALEPWLEQAQEAVFLVTSRTVLGVKGEHPVSLEPLGQEEARALFVERATSAWQGFADRSDPSSLDPLLALLDGLPLAIELAAARVRVLTPEQMLARMADRFQLLTARSGRPGRQATLLATLDWSWELLGADEQAAMAQLAVFEGGFDAEAAEAVILVEGADALDLLQALVDRSWVRRVAEDRFGLLYSMLEYARRRGAELGGGAELRHGLWFADLGSADALAALHGPSGSALRRSLALELDNLLAACRRALARGDAGVAVPTAIAAWEVVAQQGPVEVGLALAEEVLGLPLDPVGAAWMHAISGVALRLLGRMDESHTRLEQALASSVQAGDLELEGRALLALGVLDGVQGRTDEAEARFRGAIDALRRGGARWGEGRALEGLGLLCSFRGRVDEAEAHLLAALEVHRRVRDLHGQAVVSASLGRLAGGRGRRDEARRHLDVALALSRQVGDARAENTVRWTLGELLVDLGELEAARSSFAGALQGHRWSGNRAGECSALLRLGDLDLREGRLDRAQREGDEALDVARQLGSPFLEAAALRVLADVDVRRGAIGEARTRMEAARAVVEAADLPRELVRVLCVQARIEGAEGDLAGAGATLDRAAAVAAALATGAGSELDQRITAARACLETRGR